MRRCHCFPKNTGISYVRIRVAVRKYVPVYQRVHSARSHPVNNIIHPCAPLGGIIFITAGFHVHGYPEKVSSHSVCRIIQRSIIIAVGKPLGPMPAHPAKLHCITARVHKLKPLNTKLAIYRNRGRVNRYRKQYKR